MVSLRKNRNLLLLWVGQFISQTGDFLFQATLLFLVLTVEPSQSALKAGLVSFLQAVPFLAFGLVAGSLVDRYRRRSVMLLSDAARGLLLLLGVPLLWQAGLINWVTLGVLAFVLSTFSTLFNPARDSLIPEIVSRDRLFKANALIQTSMQGAMILGTFLAGTLLSVQRAAHSTEPDALPMIRLLVLDGLSLFASFAAVLFIRVKTDAARSSPSRSSPLRDAIDGLRFVADSPVLAGLLTLTAIDNFFIMGPASVGANLFIKQTLGLEAQYLAFFVGAMALGWFGGTLWMSRYGRRFSRGKLLLFGIVMDGVTYLPFLSFLGLNSYPFALALIFAHGLFIPLITVTRTTLIQEIVPSVHMGKVFAMVNLTVVGFMALSSFATGALGEVLSSPWLFFLAGAGGTISGLLGWALLGALRRHP